MSEKIGYSIGVENDFLIGPNSGYSGYVTYPNSGGTRALQMSGGSKYKRSRSKKKTNKKNKNGRKMRLRKKSKKHKHTKYCKHNKKSNKKRKTRRKMRRGYKCQYSGGNCNAKHITGGGCGCGMTGGGGCGNLSSSGYSIYPNTISASESYLANPMPHQSYSYIE